MAPTGLLGVVQARLGSTRLPQKALAEVYEGWPLTRVVLERAAIIMGGRENVVLAIPRGEKELAELWPQVVYGSESDVLERFVEVAINYPKVNTFVRFTADCPLLDVDFSKLVLAMHFSHPRRVVPYQYLTCTTEAMDGLDAEVFNRDALFTFYEQAAGREREHVTLWAKQNMVADYITMQHFGPIRWSVDDQSGLDFVRRIYAACEPCRMGIPHHTNSSYSIGGGDRHLVLDLHPSTGGGLVECTASDIYQERIGEQWLYIS